MFQDKKDFREIYLDQMTDFLWRQWSALGVLGESGARDPWIIDPEALLVFTLEPARYEPRLFDEVMDWLVTNGKWMDMQRLRGIMRDKGDETCRLVGAVSELLAAQGQERKWKNLATLFLNKIPEKPESLFREREPRDQDFLTQHERDRAFEQYGFLRNPLGPGRKSREVSPNARTTIRFMLRGLFGIGSRAECILYLMTHDGGHPSEVARGIGLSVRGTQDTLIELAKSGLVLTRVKGKRKIEYWLSQERWWEFLSRGSVEAFTKPIWIDWIQLFSALSKAWEALEEVQRTESEYMKSSKLRDAMEVVGNEFARSGLDIPPIPGRDVRPEAFQKAFEDFMIKIFGAEEKEEVGV